MMASPVVSTLWPVDERPPATPKMRQVFSGPRQLPFDRHRHSSRQNKSPLRQDRRGLSLSSRDSSNYALKTQARPSRPNVGRLSSTARRANELRMGGEFGEGTARSQRNPRDWRSADGIRKEGIASRHPQGSEHRRLLRAI